MSFSTNINTNMSSKMTFSFPNLPNSSISSSLNSNSSSPISSRPSTPPSESSYTSQNTSITSNSAINSSSNNVLSQENLDLKLKNNKLTMENMSLKLEVSKLKADMMVSKLNNQIIDEKNYYFDEYNKLLYSYNRLLRKKEELRRTIDEERKRKRKFVHILYEFGLSNKAIRKTMGDFEYSAEIRRYVVPKVTKLRNEVRHYGIGDYVGNKSFEFTNSSDLSLNISDLRIVDPKHPNENINFSIEKLDSSFGCIYDNNNNSCYNHNKSNSYNSRKVISKNGYDHQVNNNVIKPDDHFLIRFEHPIVQKEGSYKLSYRLFSKIKAITPRYKGNGTFGQKIEFEYRVSKY